MDFGLSTAQRLANELTPERFRILFALKTNHRRPRFVSNNTNDDALQQIHIAMRCSSSYGENLRPRS